jgi:hypothetical protein
LKEGEDGDEDSALVNPSCDMKGVEMMLRMRRDLLSDLQLSELQIQCSFIYKPEFLKLVHALNISK